MVVDPTLHMHDHLSRPGIYALPPTSSLARSTDPRFTNRETMHYDAIRLAMQAYLIDIHASVLNAQSARYRLVENKTTILSKKSSICLLTCLLDPLVCVVSLISMDVNKITFHRDIKFIDIGTVLPLKFLFTHHYCFRL